MINFHRPWPDTGYLKNTLKDINIQLRRISKDINTKSRQTRRCKENNVGSVEAGGNRPCSQICTGSQRLRANYQAECAKRLTYGKQDRSMLCTMFSMFSQKVNFLSFRSCAGYWIYIPIYYWARSGQDVQCENPKLTN